MEFTFTFIENLINGLDLLYPLLISFAAIVVVLGQLVGRIEGWSRFNAFYWSFITALTVGYGDIKPTKRSSKLLSILLGFLGIMFTGLIVAITVSSATRSFDKHLNVDAALEQPEYSIKIRNS